jgi:hypothetical protein
MREGLSLSSAAAKDNVPAVKKCPESGPPPYILDFSGKKYKKTKKELAFL